MCVTSFLFDKETKKKPEKNEQITSIDSVNFDYWMGSYFISTKLFTAKTRNVQAISCINLYAINSIESITNEWKKLIYGCYLMALPLSQSIQNSIFDKNQYPPYTICSVLFILIHPIHATTCLSLVRLKIDFFLYFAHSLISGKLYARIQKDNMYWVRRERAWRHPPNIKWTKRISFLFWFSSVRNPFASRMIMLYHNINAYLVEIYFNLNSIKCDPRRMEKHSLFIWKTKKKTKTFVFHKMHERKGMQDENWGLGWARAIVWICRFIRMLAGRIRCRWHCVRVYNIRTPAQMTTVLFTQWANGTPTYFI